jgi:hypothetical protein
MKNKRDQFKLRLQGLQFQICATALVENGIIPGLCPYTIVTLQNLSELGTIRSRI